MKTLSPGLGYFLYVKTTLPNHLSPSRYQAFPKYADQIITMMRTAVSKKLTNHKISMEVICLWISYSMFATVFEMFLISRPRRSQGVLYKQLRN